MRRKGQAPAWALGADNFSHLLVKPNFGFAPNTDIFLNQTPCTRDYTLSGKGVLLLRILGAEGLVILQTDGIAGLKTLGIEGLIGLGAKGLRFLIFTPGSEGWGNR